MQTKTDHSYGVVPLYKKAEGEHVVLLIHQIGSRGDRFWIFPKGHAEGDETPIAAATRELQEETGVSSVKIDTDTAFEMQYNFIHQDTKIEKTVSYFVGWCQSLETTITQPREVAELRWCTFDEAAALLTHKNTRRILQSVTEYIQQ